MRFSEYENTHITLYRDFCATIRAILEKAIEEAVLPRPQSMQCRAKEPKRLKARLEQERILDADDIEVWRRDLAGARIIFYTNTDADRFIGSRLIFNNFEVEEGGIKIHHPTKENEQNQYRGRHYTIKLKDDRTNLPEYAKFKGLRCEVQIQTVLNHAWSETSHDILYKNEPRAGFGTAAMQRIERRFNRIMTEYLLPAGYEFQRIQHDYERLQQGKEVFDRDLFARIQSATNNNERYELLSSLKNDLLPNYDDITAIYGDVLETILAVAKSARATPAQPLTTTFGELRGKTASDVISVGVEIIQALRYADVAKSFAVLRELYAL